MSYFNSRDVAAIALFASLWGVLNSLLSPIFFNIFGLPILCDIIGFVMLTISVWWIKKLGATTVIGIVATPINFIFNYTGGIFFLGFTVASVVFDVLAKLVKYRNSFRTSAFATISMTLISTLSAAVAGFINGMFFMTAPMLAGWGGVLGWAMLHAIGGVIGGIIGASLVIVLNSRGIRVETKSQEPQAAKTAKT